MSGLPFAVTTHLTIAVCESPEKATEKGHTYTEGYKALRIAKVVRVKQGTFSGASTLDIVLVDEEGNQYVTMITAALLAGTCGI